MAVSNAHSLAAARIDRYLVERKLRQNAPGVAPEEAAPDANGRRDALPVITISKTLGVPTAKIAALIAKELGFTVLDREVLDAVAQETHLGEKIIDALDAGSHSALASWLAGLVDYEHRVIDRSGFRFLLSKVIRGISYHGDAVLLGRGANFILRGTDAFCVRLTAPAALRAKALLVAEGPERCATLSEARRRIRDHAADRKHFISKLFRADIDDPEAYDAIFSLRRLDPEYGAGLVVDGYRRATGIGSTRTTSRVARRSTYASP